MITIDIDLSREATVRRIPSRQVRVCIGIAKVIDSYNLHLRPFAAFIKCPQYVAADAAIAINANLDRHFVLLMLLLANGISQI